MKITRKDKSPTEVELLIEADSADLLPIKNHTLGHFSNQVKIPGFRAGTAPVGMIEKHVDQRALADEFLEHALNQLFGQAVDEQKLRPASKPDVAVKKFVPYTTLEFEVSMNVIGPIKLPDYKKIKLAKDKAEVTTAEVNEVLKSLQQRAADRSSVDRPAKKGDEVVIDFKGKDEKGEPVPGADGKDYPLLLGSGNFIPGFEEELIGLKAGDKKDFKIKFPADYGAAGLRNKQVTFSVEVKAVNQIIDVPLDDTLSSKVGPFKTLAELKADIKKQLGIEKQGQADRAYENELIKKIADKAEVDIPKSLVDERIAAAEEQEKRDLMARGQTWQEHLKMEGVTEEEHRERQRPSAEETIKAGLVLSEVAEQEDISVTPEELEIRIQILKGQYQDPQMQAELDRPENQREIAGRLMTEKTVAKLVEHSAK